MSLRWSERETEALAQLRILLKDELASRPQYPDVIGDRRMLRFLRGKQNDVNEAAKMFSAFLKWRDENNVDDIRNQILYGGLDTPYKFPNGKKIIDLAPQIIISAKAQDFKGQPLVLEQYSFNPSDMFARVTIKDYLQFLVYGLEYRALVMEQMSHEKETKYLAEHPNVEDREDGYGVVLLNFCIRDLQGVGLSHLTGKGKQIIEAAINIGLPNYPEYLGKCHMINVPWVFTSMWFFIKGLLDEFILAKINLTGSKYLDTLQKDMPIESIPKALGGKFELYNESYSFDTSPTGPFYTEHQHKLAHTNSTNSLSSITSLPNGAAVGGVAGVGGVVRSPSPPASQPQSAAVSSPAAAPSNTASSPAAAAAVHTLPSPAASTEGGARGDHQTSHAGGDAAAHHRPLSLAHPHHRGPHNDDRPPPPGLDTPDARDVRATSPKRANASSAHSSHSSNSSQKPALWSGGNGSRPTLTRQALASIGGETESATVRNLHSAKKAAALQKHTSVNNLTSSAPTESVSVPAKPKAAVVKPWTPRDLLSNPFFWGAAVVFALIFIAYPGLTFKYGVIPALFAMFIVFVI